MPRNVTITEGDCLSSLAATSGFGSHQPIHDDDANAELKEARPNPNTLVVGDVVVVPDVRVKTVEVSTDAAHSFKLTIPPIALRIAIVDREDQPVKDLPYRLTIGDEVIEDTLPDDGLIEQVVSARVRSARLVLDPDAEPPEPPAEDEPEDEPDEPAAEGPPPYPPPIDAKTYKDALDPSFVGERLFPVEFELQIGSLPSFNEVVGVQARLGNLGFSCGGEWGEVGPATTAAVRAYQAKHGLDDSGDPADIQDHIRDQHDEVP